MCGDEWRRPHRGPTGDEGSRSTSWSRPVQAGFLEEVVNGEPVELVSGAHLDRECLGKLSHTSCIYQFRQSHLLCMVPPSITHQVAVHYDALS